MEIRSFSALLLASTLLAACNTPSPSMMDATVPGTPTTSALLGASAGAAVAVAVPTAAESSRSSMNARISADSATSARVVPPAPETRPGLATALGDAVSSPLTTAASTRLPGSPGAVATIRYDNRDGITALAANNGVSANAFSRTAMTVTVNEDNRTCHMAIALRSSRGGIYSAGPRYARDARYYVMAEAGETYTINVENTTCLRTYEAVTTVDGLDVLTGQPGSLQNRGYLVEPGKTLQIAGLRTGASTVAAFKFDTVANSYAARPGGDARNVGVIGIAFFAQRPAAETIQRTTADPFPADQRR